MIKEFNKQLIKYAFDSADVPMFRATVVSRRVSLKSFCSFCFQSHFHFQMHFSTEMCPDLLANALTKTISSFCFFAPNADIKCFRIWPTTLKSLSTVESAPVHLQDIWRNLAILTRRTWFNASFPSLTSLLKYCFGYAIFPNCMQAKTFIIIHLQGMNSSQPSHRRYN